MKMNKVITVIAAGMIGFGAMFSASAAGIGFVNTTEMMQNHPKMQKAQLDMKNAIQKAKDNFEKRSAGKTEQEKQQIAVEIQRDLDQKEDSIIDPIRQDVRKAIQSVRQEKGLDIIIEQAAVVDGGVNINSDVAAKLAK